MAKEKIAYSFGSYGVDAFYNTRFKIVAENLSPESRKKFLAMNKQGKMRVVQRMIEKGAII